MSVMWLAEQPDVRTAVVNLAQNWLHQQQEQASGILHGQVVWHDALLCEHDLRGASAVAALGSWLSTAIPDLDISVQTVLSAENHHVLLYYTAKGTHTGPLLSALPGAAEGTNTASRVQIAATGRPVTWTGSMVLRMQHADSSMTASTAAAMHVAEVWHAWDVLFVLQQIGHAPSSVPQAPAAAPAAVQQRQQGVYSGLQVCGCQPEECKAVVRKYFQTYNSGDFSQLPNIVHPAYHYWGLIDLGGKTGVPAMQAMMSGWRDALSDFSIGYDWILAAEGNRVLFKWNVRGLHTKGPLRGVPADPQSPKVVSSWGITALSITAGNEQRSGQIWRKVSHANGAALLRQLGVCDFFVGL